MKKIYSKILLLILTFSIILSGCTDSGQDITSVVKSLPEVQQFLQEHPNAKITVTYWSEEEVSEISDEISNQCDKNINPRAMYKATISEGDLKIISWIDAETQIIICTTTQGFSVSTPTTVETSAVNPTETLTLAAYQKPEISLTKEVDKLSVEMGDIIRVSIKAENTGSSPAKNIIIDPGISPGFTFKSNIYSTYPSELGMSNSYTQMYIYEIQAVFSGTFNLNPAIITYYSESSDKYTSTSNSPVITVATESSPTETTVKYYIAAIVSQINSDTIEITYAGGPDHNLVKSIEYDVNGIIGSSTGRPYVGEIYTVSGVATTGHDHVIVTATFDDGTIKVILDTYV